MPADRREQRGEQLLDHEMILLLGALCEIRWAAAQTVPAPRYLARRSIFQSGGPTAALGVFLGANKGIRQMELDPDHKLTCEPFKGEALVVGWSDAA